MTLAEQLKLLNSKEDVYISSKSAFFFIGTPDEFESSLVELDKQWHDTFYSRLQKAKTRRNNYAKMKPSENMRPFTKRVFENGKSVERTFDYNYLYKFYEKKLAEFDKQIENAKQLYYNFKHFRNREVLDVYRNIDNTATIIIIEGEEAARFWFKSEWERYQETGKLFEDASDDSDIEAYLDSDDDIDDSEDDFDDIDDEE